MALNTSEAGAVNTLLRHLAGEGAGGRAAPGAEEALDAVELLAAAAHKRLAAGYNGPRARAALARLGVPQTVWLYQEQPDEFEPFESLPPFAGRAAAEGAVEGTWRQSNPDAADTIAFTWAPRTNTSGEPCWELVVGGRATGMAIREARVVAAAEPIEAGR